MSRRIIVPFFISHRGCPHQCVFCDQRVITGVSGPLPTAGEIVQKVGDWRRSACADSVEVAFYGGTFTALTAAEMEMLLAPLQSMLRSGEVSSVRVSTRPDSLDGGTARFLRDSGVRLVELGVQSMDDTVLERAGRGHTAAQSVAAFNLLRGAGLRVGAQLMPGLPGDTPAGAVESLRRLLPLQPDLLRIYPAVVLKGTELARLYLAGVYRPLTVNEAVRICKVMLQVAAVAGIPVIRAGLHPGDDLLGGDILAGPYHPAFRQLAEGERWYDLLSLLCDDFAEGGDLEIRVAPTRVSDLVGHKRTNLRRIEASYPVRFRRIHADSTLGRDEVVAMGRDMSVKRSIIEKLCYDSSMNAVREIA